MKAVLMKWNELMNDKEIYSQQSRGKGPVERIEEW
jgi:hypothetical protein